MKRCAHGEGLNEVLQQAVRQHHDDQHDQGSGKPLCAERNHDRQRACDEGANEGNIGRDEGDHSDRSREWNA